MNEFNTFDTFDTVDNFDIFDIKLLSFCLAVHIDSKFNQDGKSSCVSDIIINNTSLSKLSSLKFDFNKIIKYIHHLHINVF